MKPSARHGVAAAVSALFAVLWSLPLVNHLSTHIPGPGAGDNVSFLWNFWWMREALASGQSPFHTTALFAPGGADLTLHTHTMLPAFAGATLLGALPVAVALNVTILAGLALNAFCAYLLAWRVTGDFAASLVAGLVFGASPFVAGHLYGHFNLTMAWTIPVFAMATMSALRGSRRAAIAAGAVLGLTAYIDYYYVIFGGVLTLALVAGLDTEWSARPKVQASSRALTTLAALITVDVLLIVSIAITGGFGFELAGKRLSLHTIFNPLQLLWLLVALWLMAKFQPRLAFVRRTLWPGVMGRLLVMLVAFALISAPILWHGARLAAHGEYVTQKYFWRSAPSGIDAATLVFGNPVGGVKRSGTQSLYDRFDIDIVESTAWFGIVPLILAAFVMRRYWRGRRRDDAANSMAVRTWAIVGSVFLIWSCGSHLMMFGVNTGMVLPQAAMRYLPIVGNARIPGRAMVLVYMALSVLVALALATWRQGRFDRRIVVMLAAAIAVDFLAAPIPLTALDHPAIYDTLRDRPEKGAVCELPMGIRDGFRERGFLDHRTLAYQTIHGRAITGGFVARMSPSVSRAYEEDPLFSAFLDLSSSSAIGMEDYAPPEPQAAVATLRERGIAFVMVNRRLAPAALVRYVGKLPLALVASDGERWLYRVD